MAIAIYQLHLPEVIQEMIKEYVFYSEIETLQRNHKKKLIYHLSNCERSSFTDDIMSTFYYKQFVKYTMFSYRASWYTMQEYHIFHIGFCNTCHNYVYASSVLPSRIECSCVYSIILDVD